MAITKIQSESLNLADNYDFTGTVTGAGGANTPFFHVYLGSNQSFTTGVETKVSLDTAHIDTASGFSSNKYTIPSGAGGKYLICSSVTITNGNGSTSVAGFLYSSIYKNGSGIGGETRIDFRANKSSGAAVPNSVILDLSAGDYLELYGYGQIDQSPIFQGGSGAIQRTYLQGFKIIE